jgi:hypothetical protein
VLLRWIHTPCYIWTYAAAAILPRIILLHIGKLNPKEVHNNINLCPFA